VAGVQDACFGHGACQSGLTGSGKCVCKVGYAANCSGATCSAGYYSDPNNDTATSANAALSRCEVCPCDPQHSVKLKVGKDDDGDGDDDDSSDLVEGLYQCLNQGGGIFQCKCKDGFGGPSCDVKSTSKQTSQVCNVSLALFFLLWLISLLPCGVVRCLTRASLGSPPLLHEPFVTHIYYYCNI